MGGGGEVDQGKMFSDFPKDRKSPKNGKTEYIVTTYSDFRVPALNVAKKNLAKIRG